MISNSDRETSFFPNPNLDSIFTVSRDNHPNIKSKASNKQSKKDQIKTRLAELAATSSIYSFTRLYLSDLIVKAIWISTTLCLLALGLYLTYNSVRDFLEYPVITNIQKVSELPVVFPAVTLCSPHLSSAEINFTASYFSTSSLSVTDFEEFTWYEPGAEQIVDRCLRFNGYRNDSVMLRTVNGTDFTKNALFIHLPRLTDSYLFAYVAPNRLNAFQAISPIYLYRTRSYNFYLTKSVETKLPEPYNRCFNESPSYYRENCIEQCVQEQLTKKYNCTMAGYYGNKELGLCLNGGVFAAEGVHCESACISGCVSLSYNVATVEDFPPDNLSLGLYVLFSNLKYTEIRQIPKHSLFDLIGSVGGTLGLFVGFQFFTIIEIFQFVYDLFVILIKN